MNLSSWLRQTVTVASVTGKNAYGDPVYGSQRSVACRIEEARRIVRKSNGSEAETTHRVYTSSTLALTDRIWLPGANTSDATAARLPLAVTSSDDKAGLTTLCAVDL